MSHIVAARLSPFLDQEESFSHKLCLKLEEMPLSSWLREKGKVETWAFLEARGKAPFHMVWRKTLEVRNTTFPWNSREGPLPSSLEETIDEDFLEARVKAHLQENKLTNIVNLAESSLLLTSFDGQDTGLNQHGGFDIFVLIITFCLVVWIVFWKSLHKPCLGVMNSFVRDSKIHFSLNLR